MEAVDGGIATRVCSDCQQVFWHNPTIVPTTGKTFCSDCKQRRGLAYLFDARSWSEIERVTKGSAA